MRVECCLTGMCNPISSSCNRTKTKTTITSLLYYHIKLCYTISKCIEVYEGSRTLLKRSFLIPGRVADENCIVKFHMMELIKYHNLFDPFRDPDQCFLVMHISQCVLEDKYFHFHFNLILPSVCSYLV